MKYKRVLLKLSGEALMGSQQYGIDPQRLADYADEIIEAAQAGVQIGIVGQTLWVDAVLLAAHQGFTAEFQEYSVVFHFIFKF